MTRARLTRRSSQGVSQPSRCNFSRVISHSPPEQVVTVPNATPLPNENAPLEEHGHHEEEQLVEEQLQATEEQHPATEEQLQATEEQHPATEGQLQATEEHHEEEHHDVPNPQPQKQLVGIDEKCCRDFKPRKAAFAKMKEIVRGHFCGPWTSISKVPRNVKNMWFEEFEKFFCWTISTEAMRTVFFFQAGKHLRNVFKGHCKNKMIPYFVQEPVWKQMETIRSTDLNMIRQSEVNKANRASKRSLDSGVFWGGSRKVSKWMEEMASTLFMERKLMEPNQ